VLRLLRISQGAWTVKIVRDAEMVRQHRQTMNIAGTTDVLTFDMRDNSEVKNPKTKDREAAAIELETLVCIDEARRRAQELGHTLRKELLLYCVHSLLHVQGYDDVTKAKAALMHQREDEILRAIGVGPVYGTEKPKNEKQKTKVARRRTKGRDA
jgi:probable rRNA maturation factor